MITSPEARDPMAGADEIPRWADYAEFMVYKLGAGMVGQGHGLGNRNRVLVPRGVEARCLKGAAKHYTEPLDS
jgi:hypothetical protein